ncbi:MAG: deoxyribodipyrimidine photolyase [Gemmatimonadota bacterium]|nr:deoxyribodipyrimidine photolyase [Gemmatimonadota bacterium]MDH3368743.1 deoxyribodipyrimidine photolyase [Gemmatimonadota bacterium]
MMSHRVRVLTESQPSAEGHFILYWMIAARRTSWNHGLDRAIHWARELGKPLVVLEPLRAGYRWASERIHQFVIDGMADNASRFGKANIAYYPYIEPSPGAGQGLLSELAARSAVVVTDDFPAFFLPRMIRVAADRTPVRFEAVDSNGLLPIRATDQVFTTAHQFRRYLHQVLPDHHSDAPTPNPLARLKLPTLSGGLPAGITKKWEVADLSRAVSGALVESLSIDHAVKPVGLRGGPATAGRVLRRFLKSRLARYADDRNQPGEEVTSGLSPYLHFGHISAHEVVDAVADVEEWSPARVNPAARGRRAGWWGMSASAESFLDELVTWREVGFNMCALRPDYDQYESLPAWAKKTLAEHARDPRPHLYALEAFEEAETHDPLWNAAQRQLVREGRIHNYLRMLWGKKIFEWSPSPEEALETMIHLNNKYALDGRDPNSYSGIFWVLGRYDRAWGPERPVFGKVRYMTSENTARKYDVKGYMARYGPAEG